MGFHSFAAGVLLGAYAMGVVAVAAVTLVTEAGRGGVTNSRRERVAMAALFGALWPLIVVLVVTGR